MNIVFAWEWGAGVSHLLRFRPLSDFLVKNGHRVSVVSRDARQSHELFDSSAVAIIPPPEPTEKRRCDLLPDPLTIAGFAWNLGVRDSSSMVPTIDYWRSVYSEQKADLVISDYGVLAAATAIACGLPVMRIGSGFEVPPATNPLTSIAYKDGVVSVRERQLEHHLLQEINSALGVLQLPAFASFGDCLGSENATMIASLPEFDAYATKQSTRACLGVWHPEIENAQAVQWPRKRAGRAFAYLKDFPGMRLLIQAFNRSDVALALVSDGLERSKLHACENVALQDGLVNQDHASRDAQFVVTNGNHGSSLRAILMGLPVLACPMYIEQRITAMRIEELGLGVVLDLASPETFGDSIDQITNNGTLRDQACLFANKHRPTCDGSLAAATEKLRKFIADN